MIATIYKTLTYLAWPALRVLPTLRLRDGKEMSGRTSERFGITTTTRPEGKIVWFHAASNGETLSAIPLIHSFFEKNPDLHILITTMTVTATRLVEQRLGDDVRIIHQFIPYDHPSWVKKFQTHWKPDIAVWVESELWPNHLKSLKENNIAAVLVNARLSDRSVKRWFWVQGFFQNMMSCFDTILAQTDRDRHNLDVLGLNNVQSVGNLKDMAPALPFDPVAADDIRGVIEARTCVLFASTHDPEEEMARDIHVELKKQHPDLLTIIIPRHPKRGEDIAHALNTDDLNIALRSLKMSPRTNTDIYVADTLGEMGLFYDLCPIVFVGNSMGTKPGGGHNLLEPAWFDCAIISGDDLHNFSIQASEMPKQNACLIAKNTNELLNKLNKLISNSNLKKELQNNAKTYVRKKQSSGLNTIIDAIDPTCKNAKIL